MSRVEVSDVEFRENLVLECSKRVFLFSTVGSLASKSYGLKMA